MHVCLQGNSNLSYIQQTLQDLFLYSNGTFFLFDEYEFHGIGFLYMFLNIFHFHFLVS